MRDRRLRLGYAIAAAVLLAAEVGIALYVRDNFVRPYVGDVLVVILIYAVVRIFLPERFRALPAVVFFFAAGVELMQYFRLAERLRLAGIPFFRILLGSVFDPADILCYAVGCGILGGYELLRLRRRKQ